MTPTSSNTSLTGLSIDDMLGTLSSQQIVVSNDQSVVSPSLSSQNQNQLTAPDQPSSLTIESEQSVLNPIFNIDALSKPTITTDTPHPISSAQEHASLGRRGVVMRTMGAMVATLVLLVFGAWFLSVQYPVQAEEYKTIVMGFFSTTLTAVNNNLSDQDFTSETPMIAVEDDTYHAVAEEYNESIETPLADSLQQVASGDESLGVDVVLDNALGTTGEPLPDTVSSSGSSLGENIPPEETSFDQLAMLSDDITQLSTSIEQMKLTYSSGTKSIVLRVLGKNVTTLMQKVSFAGEEDYVTLSSEYQQLHKQFSAME